MRPSEGEGGGGSGCIFMCVKERKEWVSEYVYVYVREEERRERGREGREREGERGKCCVNMCDWQYANDQYVIFHLISMHICGTLRSNTNAVCT
jgi:hypothetical protein